MEDHGTFTAWVFGNYRDGEINDMSAWQMNVNDEERDEQGHPAEICVNIELDFSTPQARARSERIPPGTFLGSYAAPASATGKLAHLRNSV